MLKEKQLLHVCQEALTSLVNTGGPEQLTTIPGHVWSAFDLKSDLSDAILLIYSLFFVSRWSAPDPDQF